MAPEPKPARTVQFDADLTIAVSGPGGDSNARLHGTSPQLILDVDSPVAVFRALPRSGLSGGLRSLLPSQLLSGTSVLVTSHGKDLAMAQISASGKFRVRPTRAGIQTVGAAAVISRPARVIGALAAAVAIGSVVIRRLVRSS